MQTLVWRKYGLFIHLQHDAISTCSNTAGDFFGGTVQQLNSLNYQHENKHKHNRHGGNLGE